MKIVLFIICALIIGCIVAANCGGGTSQCDIKYEWTLSGEYVPVWHCHTVNDGGS